MKSLLQYRKSYKIGLLQTKAFRILKQQANDALKPFHINATDWALLGLLLEEKHGLQLKVLANELGVKQPYLTRSISRLKELGLLSTEVNTHDTRVTLAFITKKGEQFVIATEDIIVKKVKPAVSTASLVGYLQTLLAITAGTKNQVVHDLGHLEE